MELSQVFSRVQKVSTSPVNSAAEGNRRACMTSLSATPPWCLWRCLFLDFRGESSTPSPPVPSLSPPFRLRGSVMSRGKRISTGSPPREGSGELWGVSWLVALRTKKRLKSCNADFGSFCQHVTRCFRTYLFTSSSSKELRFKGSKMFPPIRKWLGREGSDWLSLFVRRRRLACVFKPAPMEYRLLATRWVAGADGLIGSLVFLCSWSAFLGWRGRDLASWGCSGSLTVAGKFGLSLGSTGSLSKDIIVTLVSQPITVT